MAEQTWLVYGITRPDTQEVIYIGITKNIHVRMKAHHSSPDSAVAEMAAFFKSRRKELGYCLFGELASEAAARHLESALIAVIPRSYNRTNGYSEWKFWEVTRETEYEAASQLDETAWRTSFDPSVGEFDGGAAQW